MLIFQNHIFSPYFYAVPFDCSIYCIYFAYFMHLPLHRFCVQNYRVGQKK